MWLLQSFLRWIGGCCNCDGAWSPWPEERIARAHGSGSAETTGPTSIRPRGMEERSPSRGRGTGRVGEIGPESTELRKPDEESLGRWVGVEADEGGPEIVGPHEETTGSEILEFWGLSIRVGCGWNSLPLSRWPKHCAPKL